MEDTAFSREQLLKKIEALHRQLQNSQNNFNDFLNAIPEAAFFIDTKGRVIASNNITLNRVKMNQDEFIGSISYDVIPKEVAKHRKQMVNNAIRTKKPVYFDDEREGRIINNCIMPVLDKIGKVVKLAIIGKDITEKKSLQNELKQKEDSFLALTEDTSDWLWQVDEKGIYTYSNAKVKDVLGFEAEEIIGRTPFDLMPEAEAKRVKKIFEIKVKEKQKIENLENIVLNKNKKKIVLETNGIPFFDSKGNLLGYRGIDRDITARKYAEKALKESEQNYRNIFDSLADGLGIIDNEGRLIDVNPTFCKMYGYSRNELLKLKVPQLIHPDYHPVFKDFIKQLKSKGNFQGETVDIHKDGSLFNVAIRGTTVFFKGEQYLLGIITDITERKKIEERLKKSESGYLDLYENAPDMFVSVDAKNATIKKCNQTLADKLGYKKEELIGRPIFKIYSGESKTYARSTVFPKFQDAGKIDSEELKLQSKNGEIIDVLLSASGVRDDKGNLIESISVFRDITEQKRAEEALRKNEEMYKKLFENTGTATFVAEKDFTISQVNDKCVELTGFSKEEIEGKMKTTDFISGESLERALKYHMGRRNLESVPDEYEIELTDKNQEKKTVYIQVGFIPETKQSIASVIDITSRKKSEEALRTSEEKFNKAFMAGPDYISISRLNDGKYLDANENWIRITGYSREEIIGKTAAELRIWANPANRDLFAKTLREKGFCNNFETYFRMKNGDLIPCQLSAAVINIEGEKCVMAITRDITQRKIMENERETLIKELQEALAHVKTLGGMLPICSSCKKIRDDKGYWKQIESYIRDHSDAEFSHSICPDCAKNLYPEYFKK